MIEFRPNGLKAQDLEKIVGRIVMVDANVIFLEYAQAARVLSHSGKTLQICQLKKELTEERTRWTVVDRLDREDGQGVPLQMRTVKLICDTVEEVNAIRNLQDKIGSEYNAFIKSVPGRFQSLAEEMAGATQEDPGTHCSGDAQD